jgi:hypothetical protein
LGRKILCTNSLLVKISVPLSKWHGLKKYQTHDQVEATKAKAVNFLRLVLQDNARADEVEAESPEAYAQCKRIIITNNSPQRRIANMANGNGSPTKSDLQDAIDEATKVLEAAYVPESDRETLAVAVGQALDILSGDEEDEEDDDEGDDDSAD